MALANDDPVQTWVSLPRRIYLDTTTSRRFSPSTA